MFSKIKSFLKVSMGNKVKKVYFREEAEYVKSVAEKLQVSELVDQALSGNNLDKLLTEKEEYLFRAGWLMGYIKGNEID